MLKEIIVGGVKLRCTGLDTGLIALRWADSEIVSWGGTGQLQPLVCTGSDTSAHCTAHSPDNLQCYVSTSTPSNCANLTQYEQCFNENLIIIQVECAASTEYL